MKKTQRGDSRMPEGLGFALVTKSQLSQLGNLRSGGGRMAWYHCQFPYFGHYAGIMKDNAFGSRKHSRAFRDKASGS